MLFYHFKFKWIFNSIHIKRVYKLIWLFHSAVEEAAEKDIINRFRFEALACARACACVRIPNVIWAKSTQNY